MLENKKGVWKIGSAAAVVLWAIQKQQKYNQPGLQAKQAAGSTAFASQYFLLVLGSILWRRACLKTY